MKVLPDTSSFSSEALDAAFKILKRLGSRFYDFLVLIDVPKKDRESVNFGILQCHPILAEKLQNEIEKIDIALSLMGENKISTQLKALAPDGAFHLLKQLGDKFHDFLVLIDIPKKDRESVSFGKLRCHPILAAKLQNHFEKIVTALILLEENKMSEHLKRLISSEERNNSGDDQGIEKYVHINEVVSELLAGVDSNWKYFLRLIDVPERTVESILPEEVNNSQGKLYRVLSNKLIRYKENDWEQIANALEILKVKRTLIKKLKNMMDGVSKEIYQDVWEYDEAECNEGFSENPVSNFLTALGKDWKPFLRLSGVREETIRSISREELKDTNGKLYILLKEKLKLCDPTDINNALAISGNTGLIASTEQLSLGSTVGKKLEVFEKETNLFENTQKEEFKKKLFDYQENILKLQQDIGKLEKEKFEYENKANEQQQQLEDIQFQLEKQLMLANEEEKLLASNIGNAFGLEEKINVKQAEIDTLKGDISKTKTLLEDSEEKLLEKVAQLSVMSEEISSLQESNNVAKNNESLLKQQLMKVNSTNSSVKEVESRYENIRADYESRISERDRKVSNMQDEIVELKQKYEKIQNMLQEKDVSGEKYKLQLTSIQKELSKSIETQKLLNTQIDGLNNNIGLKRKEIQTCQATIDQLQRENLDMKAIMEASVSRNQQLVDEKKQLEDDIIKTSKNSEDNAQQLVHLNEKLQKKNREITTFQEKLASLTDEIKKMSDETENLKEDLSCASLKEKCQANEIKALQQSLKEFKDKENLTRTDLEKLNKDFDKLDKKKLNYERLNESLKTEIEKVKKENEEVSKTCENILLKAEKISKEKENLLSSEKNMSNELEMLKKEKEEILKKYEKSLQIEKEKDDRLAAIEKQMSDGLATSNDLLHRLEKSRDEITSLKESSKNLEKENGDLLKKNLELTNERDTLQNDLQGKQMKEEEIQSQCSILRDQLRQALNRESTVRTKLEKDCVDLRNEANLNSKQADTLDKEVTHLNAKVVELETKNQQLQKRLNDQKLEKDKGKKLIIKMSQFQIDKKMTGVINNTDLLKQSLEPFNEMSTQLGAAPLAIFILGHFCLISTKTDFSLRVPKCEQKFVLLRFPDSFRVCLSQVASAGHRAFSEADSGMECIRILTSRVPNLMKTVLKLLHAPDITHEDLLDFLPINLREIKKVANLCIEEASRVELEFKKIISILEELQEAILNKQGKTKEAKEFATQRIKNEERRRVELQEIQKQTEQDLEAAKKEVEKHTKRFDEALNQQTSIMDVCGAVLLEGVTNTFSGVTSTACEVTMAFSKGAKRLVNPPQANANTASITSEPENLQNKANSQKKAVDLLNYAFEIKMLHEIVKKAHELFEDGDKKVKEDLRKALFLELKNFVADLKEKKGAGAFRAKLLENANKLKKDLEKLENNKKNSKNCDDIETSLGEILEKVSNMLTCANAITNTPQFSQHGPNYQNLEAFSSLATNMLNENLKKMEMTRNTMESAERRADEANKRRMENLENVNKTMAKLKQVKLEEMTHEKVLEVISEGLKAFSDLRDQWDQLVIFFRNITNLIKCSMSPELNMFLEQSTKVSQRETRSKYGKEIVYQSAFQTVKVASVVHHLSDTYCKISQKHLLPLNNELFHLLSLDSAKDASEIKEKEHSLHDKAEGVSREIKRFVQEKHNNYKATCRQSIKKMETEMESIAPASNEAREKAAIEVKKMHNAIVERNSSTSEDDLDEFC